MGSTERMKEKTITKLMPLPSSHLLSLIPRFLSSSQIYLPWDDIIPEEPISGATVISLLVFFSYAIVLNTVVPISLYVRYKEPIKRLV